MDKKPIFPTEEMYKGADIVLSKNPTTAPPKPANALGWAYPLARGLGMLGADKDQQPSTGDILWILPREDGGLMIQHSGPTKTGLFAWVDAGLQFHWISNTQASTATEDIYHWPFLKYKYGELHLASCMTLPVGAPVTLDTRNKGGAVYSWSKENFCSPIGLLEEIIQEKAKKGKG